MTGIKIGLYWQVTLRFVAPAVIFVILTASIAAEVMKNPTYKSWSEEKVRDLYDSLEEHQTSCLISG